MDSTRLSLGLLKWHLQRDSVEHLTELVEEYLRQNVGTELGPLGDRELSDEKFEEIALYLLRTGRLPKLETLSLDAKLKQPWTGGRVEFEETEFSVEEQQHAGYSDWLNTFFRLDNWVCGISRGLLSVPRLLAIACIAIVAYLPFLLDDKADGTAPTQKIPSSVERSSVDPSPAATTIDLATTVANYASEESKAGAVQVLTQIESSAAATESPPPQFDEGLLNYPIEMIERQSYDQALAKLAQLINEASDVGAPSLPQLVMVEALLRKGDPASRALAWKTLVAQDSEATQLQYQLLTARFLMESSVEERQALLANATLTENRFAVRAHQWVRTRNGILDDSVASGQDHNAPEDFLDSICEILFKACAHFASGERQRALQELSYVKKRLEAMDVVCSSEASRWLLNNSRQRLLVKIDATIVRLDAMLKTVPSAAIPRG